MRAGVAYISEEIVRTIIATALVALVSLVPSLASAAVVDASLIPDGNYTVKVEKVQDGQHMLVMMQNGVETVLVAQGVDFSKVHGKRDDQNLDRQGQSSGLYRRIGILGFSG